MATTFHLVWSPRKNTLSSDPQSSHQLPKNLHCELADRNLDGQSIAYVKAHLQPNPDRNVVSEVAAEPDDYKLVYHDVSVLHQTPRLAWIYEPLHAFVRRLHQDPFVDPAIALLEPFSLVNSRSQTPTCAIRVEDKVFVSESSKPEPGPSQPRIITSAEWILTLAVWFIKDIWRDIDRRSFENNMYKNSHEDKYPPGLMTINYHGYVLDADERKAKTTVLASQGGKTATAWEKTCIATQGVGKSLYEARTLREFLCVMYDACVVQRSLYRKCSILHRDISDGNIMIAPNDEQFYEHRVQCFNETKYINQVLTIDPNTKPKPACLVADLGHRADLETACSSPEVQVERTGTPKFTALSVSRGRVNSLRFYVTKYAKMPTLEGQALRYHERYNLPENTKCLESLSRSFPDRPPHVSFIHRLFHDAESTFWTIAWFLVNSSGPGAEEYSARNRPPELSRIIYAMSSHTATLDCRLDGTPAEEEEWREVLHPDLRCVAGMLRGMRSYVVLPEWDMYPNLIPNMCTKR